MQGLIASLLVLVAATGAFAAELKKPYFAATKAGTYARYESTSPGSRTAYTYRRLPDKDGRAQIEVKAEFLEGPGAGSSSTSRAVMSKDFDFAKDAMAYLRAIEEYAFVAEGGEVTALPGETLTAIRDGASDFRNAFTFKDAAEVEGHKSDRYAYRAPSGGGNPTVDEGEVWLDASVPFAIVRQTGKITDKAGTVQSTYTMRLVAAGSEAAAEAPEPQTRSEVKPAAGPLTLKDAFTGEKLRLTVEVVAGSGGRKLSISLENKSDEPLRVLVPKGRTVLEVGSPLETLALESAAERMVEVPGGGAAAPIELVQAGERGASEGKFVLSVYEGTPLFSGSVTMDTLAKAK